MCSFQLCHLKKMDVKTTAPCSLQNSTTKSSEIAKVKMENSTTKPYEIAKVKMENTSNMEEVVTSSENAKEVKRGINEVLKEMDKEKKAKAAADQTFLDTLMADFPSEEKTNAMLGGMSLKDFSMSATHLLKFHYKVDDKDIILTTAFAM